MLETLLVIAPLFIIIFSSAVLSKYEFVDDNWGSVLNEFVLKIGFPALIFSSISSVSFSLLDNKEIIISNSLIVIGSFLLVFFFGKLFRLTKKMFNTLFISLGVGNIAYLGFPILTEVAGQEILAEASIIVACYLFWLFTIGIGYLEYSNAKKDEVNFFRLGSLLIKNPLLLAVLFGLLFSSLGISIPGVISKSISMLSASVTPVVLVVIGLFLGQVKFGKLKDWLPVFIFSISTLFILPAAFWFIVKSNNLDLNTYWASIIEAAMPLAITPFALAEQYKLDQDFIAKSIVLSTILSVITIPLWVYILTL